MKDRLLATALLVGLIVFLWYFSSVLSDLDSWNAWDQPAEVAKMLKAAVFGLIAFAGAVGVNLKALLGGFGIPIGTPAEPPPVEKVGP